MMDRLCGCTFIHPGLSIGQGFALAKRLGFTRVDAGVGGVNGHCNPLDVAAEPARYADQILGLSEAHDVHVNECFLLNFGPPINDPSREVRQWTLNLFTDLCRFASLAGFASTMVIPGPVHVECGIQHSVGLAAEMLSALEGIASGHGLRLHVEIDVDSCVNTPEAAEALCRRVPGINLTLDYSHFICQGIEAARVACLHPYTRHVHVRQAKPGRIVAGVDEGEIDFLTVIRELEDGGYDGLYCVEYLNLDGSKHAELQAEVRTRAMIDQIFRCYSESL